MAALEKTQPETVVFDLAAEPVRALNATLQGLDGKSNHTAWTVLNPRGAHALCVGVTRPVEVMVDGHVGYYCAGMNDGAAITIAGNAGPGWRKT